MLGHELTHVVQQRQGRVGNPYHRGVAVVQDPVLEAEADATRRRMVTEIGHTVRPAGRLPARTVVQRMEDIYISRDKRPALDIWDKFEERHLIEDDGISDRDKAKRAYNMAYARKQIPDTVIFMTRYRITVMKTQKRSLIAEWFDWKTRQYRRRYQLGVEGTIAEVGNSGVSLYSSGYITVETVVADDQSEIMDHVADFYSSLNPYQTYNFSELH